MLYALLALQVKDLLPDFGDGFVAACLQQLGGSPERVLNALLENTMPAQLADLDRQMSLAQWQAAGNGGSGGAASAGGGKGKGQLGEGSYDSEFPAALPGSSAGGSGGSAVGAALAAARAASSTKAPENKTARYLDVRDETYREALVSAANAAQVRGGKGGRAAAAFRCLCFCCCCTIPYQQLCPSSLLAGPLFTGNCCFLLVLKCCTSVLMYCCCHNVCSWSMRMSMTTHSMTLSPMALTA
jgi:hypothetical protein